ncbi:hypothetical protein NL108_015688, partial [Boleophthalmus pectinirostris]
VFSLVFVVGLLFNTVSMYIFACTLKLRNETTTYMMNLVVSDSLFVLSLPFRIVYFVKREWIFGPVLCKISVALFYTNMYGSILFLTCISIDRFLALVYPFRSKTIRTKRNAKLACLTVWTIILSGGIAVGYQLRTSSIKNINSSTYYCFENYSRDQWRSELSKVVMFIETVGFIIPLLLNVFCSAMVLRTLKNPQTISRGGDLNKAKVLRMIIVHIVIFCFCFIPYNVNLIFYAMVRSKVLKGCNAEFVVRTIYPIALCIAVTNCCFDPVIYYFTSESIQSSIKRKSTRWQNGTKFFDRLQLDSSRNTYRFIFYQVSYSIIFLVGLMTNTLALRRLCQRSHNKLNSTAIYIISLSVADMFFLLSFPLRIYYYHQNAQSLSIRGQWTPGAAYCQLTFTLKYISLYGSIFFLVCIAVDRYFAVVHPLSSSVQRKRVAQLLSSVLWSLVLGLSLGLLFLRSAASHQHEPCLLDPRSAQHSTIILVALGLVQGSFVLPTALLLFSYCRVLAVLRQPRHHSQSLRRKHTLTIIYWVLGVFLICFVPYHINLLGYTLTHVGLLPSCALAKVTKALHPVVLSVASSNCCLNPLIYYF